MDDVILKIASTSLAGRYARALFDISKADHIVDEVLENLSSFKKYAKGKISFWYSLQTALLRKDTKKSLSEQLQNKLLLSNTVMKFIQILAYEKRFQLFDEISFIYHLMVEHDCHYKKIEVYSAAPLLKEQEETVGKILSGFFPQSLDIHFRIDESLLSGMLIKAGTLMLDISLNQTLKLLTERLRGNI